jgi:hypothetical protein
MKKFALALLFTIVLLTNGFSLCGAPNNYCFDNVTITACTGVIYDDQGPTGAYSDNGYTMTICPDNPGDVIQLDFSAFSLQTSPNGNNSDYLSIFDGNSTAASFDRGASAGQAFLSSRRRSRVDADFFANS